MPQYHHGPELSPDVALRRAEKIRAALAPLCLRVDVVPVTEKAVRFISLITLYRDWGQSHAVHERARTHCRVLNCDKLVTCLAMQDEVEVRLFHAYVDEKPENAYGMFDLKYPGIDGELAPLFNR